MWVAYRVDDVMMGTGKYGVYTEITNHAVALDCATALGGDVLPSHVFYGGLLRHYHWTKMPPECVLSGVSQRRVV